jgi:hypothetical protein
VRRTDIGYALACLAVIVAPDLAGQVAVQGSVLIGRAEHRVLDGGTIVAASGTLFGGAFSISVRDRIEVRGEALGGRLSTGAAPETDDHDLAQLQLFAGLKVRPWLLLEGGPVLRNFTNSLARQHWTAFQVGAEARVPLAFESVHGVFRGYWMPVVSVRGLPRPDIALAAGAGLEWRGPRIGVSMAYLLERYDFAAAAGSNRPEELSIVQIQVSLRWPQLLGPAKP